MPPTLKLTISSHLFARWRCCSGITIFSFLFARWHQFRHFGYLRHQQQVDLWPTDLESGVRVTCDVRYICVNFNIPRPLRSPVRPDVSDRQTDVRQKASINASTLWERRHNNLYSPNKWQTGKKHRKKLNLTKKTIMPYLYQSIKSWFKLNCNLDSPITKNCPYLTLRGRRVTA